MKKIITMAIVCLFGISCSAQPPETKTASRPQTTAPASENVMKILSDLEAAGEKYPILKAGIEYTVETPATGDTEIRTGWVAYQGQTKESSPKFRVSFKTLKLGEGPATKELVDYALDGIWFTVAKHSIKQMTRYQMAEEGQEIQPLRLGKGPFPVPFGQKTADVLEYFEPSSRATAEGEPENTDYLLLVTHPEKREDMSIRRMEMWIDREKHLPVKMIVQDKSDNITTVVFKNIQTDVKFDKDTFDLPRKLGWEFKEERLSDSN